MKPPFNRPVGRFTDAAFFAGVVPFTTALILGGADDLHPSSPPVGALDVLRASAYATPVALWFTAFASWAMRARRSAVPILLALIVNLFVCFRDYPGRLGVGDTEPWRHSDLGRFVWFFGEAMVFASFLPTLFRVRHLRSSSEPGAWLDAHFASGAWAILVALTSMAILPGVRLGVLLGSLVAFAALGVTVYELRNTCRWLGRVRAGAGSGVRWVSGDDRESTVRFEGGTPYRPENRTLTLKVPAEFWRALREQWRRSWGVLMVPLIGGVVLVGLLRASVRDLPPRELSDESNLRRVTSGAITGVELWHYRRGASEVLIGYDRDARRRVEGIELLRHVRGVTPQALAGAGVLLRERRCELTDVPAGPYVAEGELLVHCADGTRLAFPVNTQGR